MPTDYLLTEDNDLAFGANGDFVHTESTLQHQRDLLIANKGDYRQHPLIGVGISSFINDDNLDGLGQLIQREFENDGMVVTKLNIFEDGKIDVDANYSS